MISTDINNKVKKGYKQTKLGWIPEDWEIDTLGNATELLTNGFVGKAKDHYTDNKDGVLYIQGFNVLENSFKMNGVKYVTKEFNDSHQKSELKENDLLTIQTGDVGLTTIVTPDIVGANCHALIISRFKKDKYYPMYYSQYLNSNGGRGRLKSIETGSTMKHLNIKDMKKFHIPLPPLPEQQKIASILSTRDKAIAAQEKLIAQKQELKKELVTSLIKGEARFTKKTEKWKKTSLGRIPEDWHLVKLKDLTVEKGIVRGPFGGALKKEIFVEKGYKVYEQKNAIYQTVELGKYFIDNKKFDELKRFSVKGKDLIISCSGTIGRIYEIPKDSPEGVINQALLKLTLDNEVVLNDFFVEQFKWDRIQSSVIDSTQGGAMKNLVSISEFKNTNFIIPPIEEQRNIVSVFNSSKKEIENLKLKLIELKKQKQGLMRQLLTGEKRVRL